MTNHADIFAALAVPFASNEVKQRAAPGGRQLSYITARTVMNRLDDVLGPENWWDDYTPAENSVVCKLSIRLPDGTVVTKSDAGGHAGMADAGDDDKSGFSDALKRAAAKFGVGRYLYKDGVPDFGAHPAATLPATTRPAAPSTASSPDEPPGSPLRDGKSFFKWLKDKEKKYQRDLVRHLNAWAKDQRGGHDWRARMVDWTRPQLDLAHAEAMHLIPEEEVPASTPGSNLKGSLAVHRDDELKELKLSIRECASRLVKNALGLDNDASYKPAADAVIARIEQQVAGNPWGVAKLGSLRDCRDRMLLQYVDDNLIAHVRELIARVPGEGS